MRGGGAGGWGTEALGTRGHKVWLRLPVLPGCAHACLCVCLDAYVPNFRVGGMPLRGMPLAPPDNERLPNYPCGSASRRTTLVAARAAAGSRITRWDNPPPPEPPLPCPPYLSHSYVDQCCKLLLHYSSPAGLPTERTRACRALYFGGDVLSLFTSGALLSANGVPPTFREGDYDNGGVGHL